MIQPTMGRFRMLLLWNTPIHGPLGHSWIREELPADQALGRSPGG
jgi:hypothetical protein